MLRLFKNQNPYTVILLFLVAIVLKLPLLSQESLPTVESHQVLWGIMLDKTKGFFGSNTYFYHFFSIINISLQALFLNYIVNGFNLYTKRTYLPAYTYILITSVLPQWSSLSAEMMGNWFFLAMFNLILHTYSDTNTRKILFNIGFLFGLLVLLNLPNFWFLFFIAFAISMLRAYKPAEWMVTLLGIFTPWYIFAAIAYLSDSMFLFSKVFSSSFILNAGFNNQILIGLGIVLFCSLVGLSLLLKGMNRMLFQIKKMWWVSLLFFIFSVISTIGLFKQGAEIWMIAMIPSAMLVTKIWFVAKPKWLAESFHLLLIAAVIYLNWFYK